MEHVGLTYVFQCRRLLVFHVFMSFQECRKMARALDDKISSRDPIITTDAMLSILKVSQLENVRFFKRPPQSDQPSTGKHSRGAASRASYRPLEVTTLLCCSFLTFMLCSHWISGATLPRLTRTPPKDTGDGPSSLYILKQSKESDITLLMKLSSSCSNEFQRVVSVIACAFMTLPSRLSSHAGWWHRRRSCSSNQLAKAVADPKYS